MKITRADGSIVEGTAEEIAQYEGFSRFHAAPMALRAGGSIERDESNAIDWEFVSTDVAFRALTRIKLGKETKAVIGRIYNGNDDWTSAKSLQGEIGYSPSQFAGLMGAFGRRLVNTAGYVLHSSFFEREWDEEQTCFLYRLPASVRKAVERARVVEFYDL